ncbi:MAG TPA: site-specific DNA-methyltransferase [Mycobacteriales bacterium]|nr:site-specific DNA-methyltransferase [Mycobacteriales bacterium]
MTAPVPEPFYADAEVTLYAGDAGEVLAGLPAASVDCVVTSPPYWGLRDYGTRTWTGGDPDCPHPTNPARDPSVCGRCGAVRADRQYGLEPTPAAYIDHLRGVFAQLARVLNPAGTVWLNLGDSYSANSDGYPNTAPGRLRQPAYRARRPVGHKNLLGMPWRVAFALQDDGWTVRNAVIWEKPNGMPESVRDRLTCRYEYVFLLVRSRRYWFDLDPIRQPLARPDALDQGIVIGGRKPARSGGAHGIGAAARRRGHTVYGGKYQATAPFAGRAPGAALRPTGRAHDRAHPRGKNPGDVWSIPTRPLRAAHFAAFPVDLPDRCIAAGCPPGGVVLDPFSGAGTTALAAVARGARFVGIDLNEAYHTLALDRLGRPHPDRRIDHGPGRDAPRDAGDESDRRAA